MPRHVTTCRLPQHTRGRIPARGSPRACPGAEHGRLRETGALVHNPARLFIHRGDTTLFLDGGENCFSIGGNRRLSGRDIDVRYGLTSRSL